MILLVDDNLQNLGLLDACLSQEGYETACATTGAEALALARASNPDLVLLDVLLPDVIGYEVCRRLKAEETTRLTPVVMVTALTELSDKIQGIEAGADDFLYKPFNRLELLTRVKSLLRVRALIRAQRESDRREAELQKQIEIEKHQQAEQVRRKELYREVIYAVTNGRLNLIEREALPLLMEEGEELAVLDVREPRDLLYSRRVAEQAAEELGLPEGLQQDLALCVSEAATNAIKHAHGSSMSVRMDPGFLRIWVTDEGSGISFTELPKATLMRGYSTKPSLGCGFTILLELLSRVYLCTDSSGTTLGLEMERAAESPEEETERLLAAFPEV
ncbi:MAG TPA: response regulator [Armatimonadota bacterium]|jgi:DNA-binding response OmpR family regulator/anti-sigma regulatory factor (Ser/Thr protein kinase)